MKLLKNIPFLFLVSLLSACQSISKEDLYGVWQAVDLTEEGTPLEVNLSEISLSFDEQEYEFNSTLNYREAGSYYLQASLLVTKDTLKVNGVKIGLPVILGVISLQGLSNKSVGQLIVGTPQEVCDLGWGCALV